jgi:type II secretory pathway component PulM
VPIEADRNQLVANVPKLRAQAQQLTRDASEVSRLRNAVRSRTGTTPPQRAIEDAMVSAGLGDGYSGTAGLGEGRVQVNMGVVAFDPLVRALAELAQAHGLAVETIAVRSTGEPGKVRVETLVLKGPRNG